MENPEKKVCSTCHEEKIINEFYYHRGRKTYANSCKKCNSKICSSCGIEKSNSEFYFNKSIRHNCYMNICKKCSNKESTEYYSDIKTNSKKMFQNRSGEIYRRCRLKKLPYMKKLGEHLEYLWNNSNHKCYYTGREMVLTGYQNREDNAVTVDRIIPEIGYVEGNVVLCSSIANRVKQDMSINEMISFFEEVINHHRNRKDGQ